MSDQRPGWLLELPQEGAPWDLHSRLIMPSVFCARSSSLSYGAMILSLSAHQLGVYLTCYLKDGDHTVRGLAADLNVSKSVITRALDKLGELDLARRRPDPSDRRSVLVEHTPAGEDLLDELRSIVVHATVDNVSVPDRLMQA